MTFGGGADPCSVTLVVTNSSSADPGVTGVGKSVICWLVAESGDYASSITSGTCDPEMPCTFTIYAELNIEPTGTHDAKAHYEYWHGAGSFGPPPVLTTEPTWTLGGNAVGNGSNTVQWGPPSTANPSGYSEVRVTIQVEIKCGDVKQKVTAIAVPANGDVSKAVSITFEMSCSKC